ncbi:MAG: hypothetical protein L3J15_07460 [Devosiaceae bacterium]|nr:hypothetical protein [Devosiaceae bacterium]
MRSFNRSYSVAQVMFQLIGVLGWIMVLVGVIFFIISLNTNVLVLLPFVGIVVAGLLIVAFTQSARANVDTAEMMQELLKHIALKDKESSETIAKIKENKQTLKSEVYLGKEKADQSSNHPKTTSRIDDRILADTFMNIEIYRGNGGFFIRDKQFPSLLAAKEFIKETLNKNKF